eukprot:4636728-Prymnesium_polylepis.1
MSMDMGRWFASAPWSPTAAQACAACTCLSARISFSSSPTRASAAPLPCSCAAPALCASASSPSSWPTCRRHACSSRSCAAAAAVASDASFSLLREHTHAASVPRDQQRAERVRMLLNLAPGCDGPLSQWRAALTRLGGRALRGPTRRAASRSPSGVAPAPSGSRPASAPPAARDGESHAARAALHRYGEGACACAPVAQLARSRHAHMYFPSRRG